MDYYSAPAPSPEPSYSVQDDLTDYATNVGSTASVGGGFDDDSDDIQDDLTDYATNVMKTADPEGGFEDDDTGESLYITKKPTVPYVSPTQTMKEEEPYYGYTPGPNTVTAQELSDINNNRGDNEYLDMISQKIQAVNPIEKAGFFDSGIGSVLKGAAVIAAPYLAAPLAGAAFGKTAYDLTNLGFKANNLSKYANKFGLTDKTLAQTLLNPNRTTNVNKPPTGFDDSDGNGGNNGNTLVAKNVIAKSRQNFSPSQTNQIFAFRDGLLNKAERGTLNQQDAQYLTQVNKLIEEYLV